MSRSYEELKGITLDVLSGKKNSGDIHQFDDIITAVGNVLRNAAVENASPAEKRVRFDDSRNYVDSKDREALLEIFWDLFRQGIVTLGMDDCNRAFPFFHVTSFGKKIISEDSYYFIHDISEFEGIIKRRVPNIDSITLLYLKESMQAFRSSCYLSSTVTLGVAAEHTFELLADVVAGNALWSTKFSKVSKQKWAASKIDEFWKVVKQNQDSLPRGVRSDLEIQFLGIQSIIRKFRNESGHPSGEIPSREEVYMLINLFVPYCEKAYALMEFFRKP